MPEIELSAGTIEYLDTGGDGPVVVLVHGLAMDGTLWRKVVPELAPDHRVVVPTLPLGSHRHPMRPDADLGPGGVGLLLAEFLDRLDLRDATLVENDAALVVLLIADHPERTGRIARLVLASVEAFENYPPGLPGKALTAAARLPGGINLLLQPLRLRFLRNGPLSYGLMANRPIPAEITDGWLRPLLTNPANRRDLRRFCLGSRRDAMLAAAARLHAFDRPALVLWGADDRMMPPAHGPRLAAAFADARHAQIPDSGTLIPEDQLAALAEALRAFIAGND